MEDQLGVCGSWIQRLVGYLFHHETRGGVWLLRDALRGDGRS